MSSIRHLMGRQPALAAALLTAACAIATAATSASAEQELIPAQFGSGPESVVSLVACPNADRDVDTTHKVFCQAALNNDGSVKRNGAYCFSTDDSARLYVKAAREASEQAVFKPAWVDDTAVPVLLNYQLLFRLKAGGCRVAAIPNHGANGSELGLAYYAPQVIDADDNGLWRNQLFRPTGSGGTLVSSKGIAFVLAAAIDKQGNISNARVQENNFGARTDVQRALSALRRSKFIPGYVGGEPAAVRYVYFLYYDPDEQPDLSPARSCC